MQNMASVMDSLKISLPSNIQAEYQIGSSTQVEPFTEDELPFFDFLSNTSRDLALRIDRNAIIDWIINMISKAPIEWNREKRRFERNTHQLCRSAVSALLKYHELDKDSMGLCRRRNNHQAIYVAMEVAFHWRLEDGIVTKLMYIVGHCDGSFERFHLGALCGQRYIQTLLNTYPDFHDEWFFGFKSHKQSVKMLCYFADLAAQAKMVIIHLGRQTRFIDVPLWGPPEYIPPLVSACQLLNQSFILICLQYGAKMNYLDSTDRNRFALSYLVDQVRKVFNVREGNSPNRTSEEEFARKCMKVFLRAVPYFKFPEEKFKSRQEIKQFERLLVEKELLEEWQVSTNPPPLQHLAKCAIRQVLNNNYQLPRGIFQLKIPLMMQRYVNLQI